MPMLYNFGHHRLPDGRRFEGWANGIPFDSELVSSQGAGFELFPTEGVHTRSDVTEAKRQLRDSRDVVVFYVTKLPAGTVIPGPILEPEESDA